MQASARPALYSDPASTTYRRWHSVWPWALVWLFAVAVRLVYLWEIHDDDLAQVLLGDAVAYDAWARKIAAGNWLGYEVFYQAPLYPYFLGVLYWIAGPSLLWVRLVQICIGATSCLLVARADRRLFSDRIGLVAGVLLAINPAAVYSDALIQKTVLDGFLFALLLWTLSRNAVGSRGWPPIVGAGLALGLLALTRENALLLAPIILAWLAVSTVGDWRTRGRAMTALLIGMTFVLLPVALRNLAVGGEFHLTTSQLGPNFYIGNNAQATGQYMPLRFGRGRPGVERTDATESAEAAMERKLSPGEVSRYWLSESLSFMRLQPLDWAKLMLRKWLLVWNATELGDSEDQYSFAQRSRLLLALTFVLHFGVLCPLAIVGVVLLWPERRRL